MNSADTKQAKQQIEENQAEARLQAHRLALEINGKFMKSKAAYTVEVKTKHSSTISNRNWMVALLTPGPTRSRRKTHESRS
jgi:hypothetical protein